MKILSITTLLFYLVIKHALTNPFLTEPETCEVNKTRFRDGSQACLCQQNKNKQCISVESKNKCGSSMTPKCTKSSGKCKCSCKSRKKHVFSDQCKAECNSLRVYADGNICASNQYRITIHINSDAATNIRTMGYDLLISKGFGEVDTISYNTAWIVKKNDELQSGTITICWVMQNRAQMVDKISEGELIEYDQSLVSPTFEATNKVTYTGTEWEGPDVEYPSPEIGVQYTPDNVIKYVTLFSPKVESTGNEVWNPYYLSKYPLAASILTGYPVINLAMLLTHDATEDTFVGDISSDQGTVMIEYGSNTYVDICLAATGSTVIIEPGSC